MEQFDQLKKMLDELEADFEKFYAKGNNSAGTRIRVGLNNLRKTAQDIRLDIQEKRKLKS